MWNLRCLCHCCEVLYHASSHGKKFEGNRLPPCLWRQNLATERRPRWKGYSHFRYSVTHSVTHSSKLREYATGIERVRSQYPMFETSTPCSRHPRPFCVIRGSEHSLSPGNILMAWAFLRGFSELARSPNATPYAHFSLSGDHLLFRVTE